MISPNSKNPPENVTRFCGFYDLYSPQLTLNHLRSLPGIPCNWSLTDITNYFYIDTYQRIKNNNLFLHFYYGALNNNKHWVLSNWNNSTDRSIVYYHEEIDCLNVSIINNFPFNLYEPKDNVIEIDKY